MKATQRIISVVAATLVMGMSPLGFADAASSILGDIKKQNKIASDNPYDLSQKEKEGIDRRRFAEKAENDGKAGAALALAAGVVMTATGARLVATLAPIPVAIGIDLLAKGAQEIVQGAADLGTAQQNGDQKEILKLEYGYNRATPSSWQEAYRNDITNKLNNIPELDKVLSDRGVDKSDFIDKLATGQFKSADDIRRALKDNTELSDSDRQQVQIAANEATQRIMTQELSKLGYNEKGEKVGDAVDSSSAFGSAGVRGTLSPGGSASLAFPVVNQVIESSPTNKGNRSASQADETPSMSQEKSTSASQGFSFPFGAPPASQDAALPPGVAQVIQILGVKKTVGKDTIFHIAHRYYRSYNKWRKATTRVAGLY